MKIWHKNLQHRFGDFPLHQQILMICNELNRAENFLGDESEYKMCIERALELIDFSIQSKRWNGKYKEILRARDVIAKLYIAKPEKTLDLQKALISLNTKSFEAIVIEQTRLEENRILEREELG